MSQLLLRPLSILERGAGNTWRGYGRWLGTLALGLGLTSPALANEVRDWNSKAASVVDQQSPMEQTRTFAIVQLAVSDALNAIERRHEPYAFRARARGASPEAAVAAASRTALLALVPSRATDIEAWYSAALAAIPEGRSKERGVELGREAAARLLALRAGDDVGAALTEPYEAGTGPGDYRATPPFDIVVGAGWGKLMPFALPRATVYRPPPPPPVGSARYARDYEEVKALGVQAGSTRTEEQSQIADFWYESSATGWVRIANVVAAERGLDLWESARVLGLVSVALADGFIAGFEAKYHYDYWRPLTAIRVGDEDRNPRTRGDTSWTPYCVTPPVADYPSTHSSLGAAAAAVLAGYFGDATPFNVDSLTLPGVTRSFGSFSEAARENAESRVYCGIHWRFSIERGLEQGQRVGEHVLAHTLERVARPAMRLGPGHVR